MNYLLRWLLHQLQKRCTHPDRAVHADILEGELGTPPLGGYPVLWCKICGAWTRPHMAEWRRPEPLWVDDSYDDDYEPDLNDSWYCNCGYYSEDGFHCPICRAEPPWGCPCSMCESPDEYDPDMDFGYEIDPYEVSYKDEPAPDREVPE